MGINLKYQSSYKVLSSEWSIIDTYIINRITLLIILQNVLIKHISQSMMNKICNSTYVLEQYGTKWNI